MKAAGAPLIAYLASLGSKTDVLYCDLFTFQLANGFTAYYCDKPLVPAPIVGGHTYDGSSILIKSGNVRTVIGVEIDNIAIDIVAASTHLLNGTPWLQALKNGALDGAVVTVDRCYMPTWGDVSLGTINRFFGSMADSESGRLGAKVNVHSMLELLNIQMPRNIYQPSCRNTLFDAGCTNNNTTNAKSTRKSSSTVQAGSTKSLINCGLTQADDWFTSGTVTFTSGVNNGLSYTVKQYTVGVVKLMFPLLQACSLGDTFDAYWGCNRLQPTCSGKFGNLDNLEAEPNVPAPELAV